MGGLFRLLTNLGEKLTKEEAKALMKELCEPENEEGFMEFKPFLERMCAARSKCLPVLSDLYCTILYCTLQSSNGTLHSCPEQSLGSLCRLNCNCPSIFVAVKFCLTFVLVSVFIVYRV